MAKKNNIIERITPEELWRSWICEIVQDPSMDKDRAIAHVRKHILEHMPDVNDSKERWEEWLAGVHNLLAILGNLYEIAPPHELGIELLYRKWLKSPFDHTPPPIPKQRVKKRIKKTYGGGS